MLTKMNLAIVGSHVLDANEVFTAAFLLRHLIKGMAQSHSPGLLVISGGAAGIDSIATSTAYLLGVTTQEFLPKTRDWDGYKHRNLQIVEACDTLLCIRAKTSETYGSGWTADRAEERGKVVHRIYL